MKFEKQRITTGVHPSLELSNQDYLTFRNQPSFQLSGRTVYSQQFDHRSLQKASTPTSPQPNAFNFRKNIRNIRSQDKYKQISQEALYSTITDQNGQSYRSSQVERNQELKTRIGQLTKNIKRAYKKQSILDEQILMLKGVVEQNKEQIQKMGHDMDELSQISQDNVNNYNSMLTKIKRLEEQAHNLAQTCTGLDRRRSQQEVLTARVHQESYKQLMEGMKRYQQINLNLTNQITFFTQQIYKLDSQLEQLEDIEDGIRGL